jgi:hypothetical protein
VPFRIATLTEEGARAVADAVGVGVDESSGGDDTEGVVLGLVVEDAVGAFVPRFPSATTARTTTSAMAPRTPAPARASER